MRRINLVWVYLVIAMGYAAAQTTAPKVSFIACGSLFDGKSDKLQKNVVVEIQGERIFAVGASAPAGATIVDLSKETCLPGLIDAHTHVLLKETSRRRTMTSSC